MDRNGSDRVIREVEKRLSDVFGEAVKVESSRVLTGGCINHASKIDTNCGSFFIKWNSDCESDIFTREAESLKELKKASNGKVWVPKVFYAKD